MISRKARSNILVGSFNTQQYLTALTNQHSEKELPARNFHFLIEEVDGSEQTHDMRRKLDEQQQIHSWVPFNGPVADSTDLDFDDEREDIVNDKAYDVCDPTDPKCDTDADIAIRQWVPLPDTSPGQPLGIPSEAPLPDPLYVNFSDTDLATIWMAVIMMFLIMFAIEGRAIASLRRKKERHKELMRTKQHQHSICVQAAEADARFPEHRRNSKAGSMLRG